MAQETLVILTDDLDGSEATQTITFARQGASYDRDFNDERAASIEMSLAERLSNARKISSGRGASALERRPRRLGHQAGRS